MKKILSVLAIGVALFAQDTEVANESIISQNTQPASGIIPNSPVLNRPSVIKISGIGEGVPPISVTSPAQARALARRAAIADAYRSLAEKMYGIRLSAKDRIRDLVAQKTEVRTAVYGIIRGATIDEENWKDGLYKIVLVVHLDACMWSNYLSAPSLYQCNK